MLWLATGCAGGRIVEGVYQDSEHRYQVRPPASPWIPMPLDGAVLSFKAPVLQAAMALGVNCMAPEPGELLSVSRHLYFGLQDKRIQGRDTVRLNGADGTRTRLLARLDDVPVEVEGVTARRAGCLYDFMYAAPPANFARGRHDFEAFVESWAPLSDQ